MPELIDLNDRDRRLAKRMWQELNDRISLEESEDAVQIVKQCRQHGINPASIIGSSMETFIRIEQADGALEEADRLR